MQCTNSTAYQIGLNNGNNSSGNNRYMKKTSGNDLVRYELYTDAGRTVRWGNTKDVDTLRNQPSTTGTGLSIPFTVYAQAYPTTSATAGDYADTVTVTVYF
jgi:spore coat protein U-like protein